MIKLRVNDLAGEFGVSNDELLNLLRQMDVPVRSHLSEISDDQVARLRARWEREKRVRAEKPSSTPTRRRRSATAAPPPLPKPAKQPVVEVESAPEPAAATAAGAKIRRRRAVDVAAAATHAAEVEAAASADAVASKIAFVDAGMASAIDAEPVSAGLSPTAGPETREKQTAQVTVADPPPTNEMVESPVVTIEPIARIVPRPHAPPAGGASSYTQPPSRRPTPVSRDWQSPRAPAGGQRPTPVASGVPFAPPRPIATGVPGGSSGASTGATAGATAGRRDDKRGGKRRKKRGSVDQEAVTANISKTMTAMRGVTGRRVQRRDDFEAREEMEAQRAELIEREKKTVHVNEFITVSELAETLKISATEIVGFAFKNLGLMVTINQRLDFDQIELIAGEFGFRAVREAEYSIEANEPEADAKEDLVWRPPVVTIMGHVDHGKTSLLDYIRKANVVAGEAGGITQHIGAYHVTLANGRHITFLDTPGHEAFTAMRARGAQVTDIVVLVVAADDQVMPQTVEAISHARNAGVPMIVAINKIDLPSANIAKVKQDMLQHGVVLEEFGGNTLSTPISAKKGTNVAELLEQLLLQAEILDLKANPKRRASGAVVEAQLDPGKGAVATVLVQNGTLRVGDDFICGLFSGRVRALLDERGKPVKEAGPAIPVQVLGLTGTPMAGDQFLVVEDATEAREIAQRRERLDREAKSRRTSKGIISLEDFMSQTAAGERRTLKLLIKADQGGPAEALADSLGQLSNQEVSVDVIQRGVGAVTESDILLAKASGAIIIGFHVRPDTKARAVAEREGVDIKLYKVIYEAVADVRAALEGMLRPEEREVIAGEAEVRELFRVPKMGVIAGCSVRNGIINRQNRVRVIRDGVEVYDGTIGSLRRFKDDVREVRDGFECGIGIDNFNDIKVGDIIESYRKEEVARTLQPNA